MHDDLFRWAYSLAGDEADDIVQQSYTLILEGKARYDQRSALKTWAFGVVRNVSRRNHRVNLRQRLRDSRWAVVNLAVDEAADEASNEPLHELTPQESRGRLVSEAIRALPVRQREVLELHTYREFSLEDCAHILRISLGSARTHYHRAKTTLRAQLEEV